MRILYCNKYDYPFSGTEAYLFDLIERMDRRGHDTALFSMDHGSPSAFTGRAYRVPLVNFKDPHAGFLKKARMAAHALYSPSVRRAMRKCIADFSPDLAHIRGIYHHLSPSILWELKRQHIPVLYHINDFKILCPTYNLVAHGEACQACRNGAFYHAVTERCYTGPQSSAMVLAAEAYLHKWLRTYESCVDLFLAPSEFVRSELIANGLPAGRIEVLPHFQALPSDDQLANDEGYLLYFGRLSPEKGLDELLHALVQAPHIPVVIAGDGPEREHLQTLAQNLNLSRVLFAGSVNGERLKNLIARCSFSLFPSHAYETLGKSILESYAYARPVVASDLGSRREFVEHGATGLLYSPGDRDQLAHSISFLFERNDLIEKMGANGRARVKAKHDPEQHLLKLSEIYNRLTFSSDAMTSDYDVIHYHCLGPALFSFLPRLAGKKTVVTVQGLDWQRAKWGAIAARVLRWGEAAAVTLPNATMVVSKTLQRHYRDRYQRETIYVPNGATSIRRRPVRRLRDWDLLPDNYVLFLGRLSPEKNCHLLIEAFEKIRTDMKLVLAGGSSHSDSHVASLRRHESDRVRFLPWISGSDLEEVLSNAALFVLPSELEGLSLALLDAMAAGVCVLTSDIPENREAIEGAGFTFRRGDNADLERMLDVLVHNPELRRQAAVRERARVQEQYLWPEIARSIETAYYQVLGWNAGERVQRGRIAVRTSPLSAQGLD